jgi:hypothetical protein
MNATKRSFGSLVLVCGLLVGCDGDSGNGNGPDGSPWDGATESCSDGIVNQDESDVDCGGVCGATCTPGQNCNDDSHCTSNDCDGTCQPFPTCVDATQNGEETDVDCGGTECDPCDDGEMCLVDADCTSGACNSEGICVPVYTVGGTVTGVAGTGLVLQNNGGDDLVVAVDGAFLFSTPVPIDNPYHVTVLTGPGTPEQACRVSFGSGTVTGNVTDIAVWCVTSPDNIADALALAEGVEVRFSTVGATVETDEDYCDEGGTVWFSFTATHAGEYVAYATGSDHDTELTWSDSLTGPTYDCNDDADDSYDAVDAQLTFATDDQKYVQVGLNSTDNVGTGGVGVTEVLPAADNFADAATLELRSGALTAVTGLAFAGTEALETDEATTCGSTTLGSASAWLQFVAPFSGTWMFESKSNSSTDLALYQGSAVNSLTLLNCATTDHIAVLVDLTAGETYRIRVSHSSPSGDDPVVVRAERTAAPMTAALVDADGDGTSTSVGSYSDLVVVDGEPAIAYYDATNDELRFAHRSGGVWSDVLVDADGDGTATDVGRYPSLAVLANGEPVVAYYDGTNQELRFAERSGGVWSDVLVDADGDGTSTDVGSYPSLAVLASGEPAVAYYDGTNRELRFAQRSGGVWSDVLVDADGDSTSDNVGHYPGLIELATGLGISYIDETNHELRFARHSDGTWTDELVFRDELDPNSLAGAGVVLDSAGHPVLAATESGQGNHVIGWWNGASWDIERDFADRHIGELDFNCSSPRLLIDGEDRLYLVWTDCNYSYSMAISVRDSTGAWGVRDVAAHHLDPSDISYPGTVSVEGTQQFGAAWLPDGTLAVSFHGNAHADLWCAVGL